MIELLLGAVVFVPVIWGCIVLYRYMTKYENRVENQIRSAAEASGATYWKGMASDRGLRSLVMDGDGHSSYVRYGITYADGTEIGQAHFTINGIDATIAFDFATLPLEKYPSLWLVVDSRKNNIVGRSLMDAVDVSRKLNPIVLEGNFPDTYKVYANTDQQIGALVALNPASMEKLLRLFTTYDMEINGGHLYIYTVATTSFYASGVRDQMVQDIKTLGAILAR